jgi:mRNA-degrading endonuclease toxin of MazEF toxin-antitoxin module
MAVMNPPLAPGQIVRCEVPFSDVEGRKTRFPVIVSSRAFNDSHAEVIVAYVTRTGNITRPHDYDVQISNRHPDFAGTGLTESSTVRCGRLFTVDKRSVSDVLGQVPDDLFNDIIRLVRNCFAT